MTVPAGTRVNCRSGCGPGKAIRRVEGLVVLTLLVTAPLAAGPLERLEELGRALRSRPVWTASYTQEYIAAGMTQGTFETGRVWVAWPDRARFETGDPPVRMMGLAGRQVRLVDLEVPSCDEELLDDEQWARIPLAAVLDPHEALERFTVLESGDDGIALVPREIGGVSRVVVVLGTGSLPARVTVIDPQGAVNRLDFEAWTEAAGPPGGGWLPAAPEGVECIVPGGG